MEMTMTEKLHEKCQSLIGEHYTSERLHDDADIPWDQHWPTINADGTPDGGVLNCDDSDADDFANVRDMAMILISNLPKSERDRIKREKSENYWDGYAST